uniref:CMP/dCMP-type deaminase domain-containing protein n=1 Tax=Chelydra serpentina TaxID=8475 RepID=A0A8C3TKH1_CHESE
KSGQGVGGNRHLHKKNPRISGLVLPKETYLLYEIKWSNSKRPWQSYVFQEQRSDPSVHCSITWYMSWSPCADCCRAIRDFLKEQPNVNLVIYVARIYWHKEENNRLRDLVSSGVNVHIMTDSFNSLSLYVILVPLAGTEHHTQEVCGLH